MKDVKPFLLLGPVVELIPGAFAGGVIALLLARLEIATTAPRRRAAA